MAKVTLTDVTSGFGTASTINTNNAAIEAAIENTLSRDGTSPNTMSAALDMNSQRIINLPNAVANQEPITLAQAGSIAGVTNPLTQETVAAVLYPRTAEEVAAGITPTNYKYPEGYVYRYGTNTSPGVTNMVTAINNAILVMSQHDSGGSVIFPADNCLVSSTINGAINVSLIGHGGMASTITANNCDAITLGFNSGFGHTIIRDLNIQGTSGSTRIGIKAPGSLDYLDELYGLTIERCLIRGFNVGIHWRTVRNGAILNNWIQDVDKGIELIGKNLVVAISFNKITRAAGAGGSVGPGIMVNYFDYTTSGGIQPPEGIQLISNQVYGFDTGINVSFVNYINIIACDLAALIYGIDFSVAQYNMTISDCYFDLVGTNVIAGIYGRGQASTITTKINITHNVFVATTTTASTGVKINDAGNQNQNFVTVQDNLFTGLTSGDILFNNAGSGAIINNRCTSTVPAASISVPNVLSGIVYIDKNLCTKIINWDAGEAASGEVILGHNIHSGTTAMYGSQQVPTVASATALTLPLGANTFIISGTTTITSVVATGWVGRTVTLHFADALTFTDGGNLALAGNFVTTANDTITITCVGATWNEVCRSVN